MTLTLRYKDKPENEKILKAIMIHLNTSTRTGAIYTVCKNYMAMNKTIEDLREKKNEIEHKFEDLIKIITLYIENKRDGIMLNEKMVNAIKR